MVERPLSMREVPGSIPGFSNDRGSIVVFFSFASSFLSLFLLYFSYAAV